jgi:hypothetical protein
MRMVGATTSPERLLRAAWPEEPILHFPYSARSRVSIPMVCGPIEGRSG